MRRPSPRPNITSGWLGGRRARVTASLLGRLQDTSIRDQPPSKSGGQDRVYPFCHMPQPADTAIFAVSEGLARRETLFGTGAERLTPVFCSIATHGPT
jgi:hypothetical protein